MRPVALIVVVCCAVYAQRTIEETRVWIHQVFVGPDRHHRIVTMHFEGDSIPRIKVSPFPAGDTMAVMSNGFWAAEKGRDIVPTCISDSQGLLFYVGGVTPQEEFRQTAAGHHIFVFSYNHTVIGGFRPESALAGGHRPQSLVVVPNPADKDEYYIFTTGMLSYNLEDRLRGLWYTRIRIGKNYRKRQNDQDIQFIEKNVQLRRDNANGVAAVSDCSGEGYWVTVVAGTPAKLYAYHVTRRGVDPTPVISDFGARYGIAAEELSAYTQMLYSPDGRKVLIWIWREILFPGRGLPEGSEQVGIYYCGFDSRTGRIVRVRPLYSYIVGDNNPAGVYYIPPQWFSKNSRYLYWVDTLGLSNILTQDTATLLLRRYHSDSLLMYSEYIPTHIPIKGTMHGALPRQVLMYLDVLGWIGGGWTFSTNPLYGPDELMYLRIGWRYQGEQNNYGGWLCLDDSEQGEAIYRLLLMDSLYAHTPMVARALTPPPNYITSVFAPGYPESVATCALPQVELSPVQVCAGECYQWRPTQVRFTPTEYRWQFEGGEPAAYTGAEPPPVCYRQAGRYRTLLIACNGNGCDTAEAAVVVREAPVVEVSGDTVLCAGEIGMLQVRGGVRYQWRVVGSDTVIGTGASVSVVGGERYEVVVWDGGGCMGRDTVEVVFDQPRAVRFDTVVCRGSRVVVSGGEGSRYVWRDGSGRVVSTAAELEFVATEDVEYGVEVQGQRCVDSGYVRVRVRDGIVVEGLDVVACQGDRVELRVRDTVAGAEYRWYDSGGQEVGQGSRLPVVADRSTWYVVEGQMPSECRGRDTVFMDVFTQLRVIAVSDTSVCLGSRAMLRVVSGAPGAEYVWYRDGQEVGRGTAVIVVVDRSGEYVVRGRLGACTGSDTVEVGVYPPVEVRSRDVTVCVGEEAELVLEGNGERCWWEDSTGQVVSQECRYRVRADRDRQYRGVMEDAHGCRMSAMAWVRVQPRTGVVVRVEPSLVEVGAGERVELSVQVESSSAVRMRDVEVRVRVEGTVCDVEGSRWDGEWQVVEKRWSGEVDFREGEQELLRIGVVGVVGGEHRGPVVVEFVGDGCAEVEVRGGEVYRKEVCVDGLRGIRLVESMMVEQEGEELVVRGDGVGEVRLYTVVGQEVRGVEGRRLWIGDVGSGVYVVRVRVGDVWHSRLVWVMR